MSVLGWRRKSEVKQVDEEEKKEDKGIDQGDGK